MGFRSSILAGKQLIREAIQSGNYVPGLSGWTINRDGSAEFGDLTIRSSDMTGRTVVVANGKITILAPGGIVVTEIDSDGYRLYNNSGVLVADLRLDSNGDLGGLYTRGFQFGNNIYSYLAGGTLKLGPVNEALADDHASIGYVADTAPPFPFSSLALSTGAQDSVLDTEARLRLISMRGQASRALIDGGPSGATADLEVTGKTQTGSLSVLSNPVTSYVPAVTGGGTATFTTQTGWYYDFGGLILHSFSIVVGVAGSGTGVVQISAPTNINRSRGRQSLSVNGENLAGANNGSISLVSFTSGTGAIWDRLRNSVGANITGASLAAGSFITGTGLYLR